MRDRLPPPEQWQFYERQTAASKRRALERLLILDQVAVLTDSGMSKSSAVRMIADTNGASGASIWNWVRQIAGVSRHDRLAYLVARFRAGGRPVEVDQTMLQMVAADYLRPERPSWAACVRRLKVAAREQGVGLPHAKTLWRRLCRIHDMATIARMRSNDSSVGSIRDSCERTLPRVSFKVSHKVEGKVVSPYFRSMGILTVTAKGQVTLKKDILRHLGVHPGDRIVIEKLPDGRVEVKASLNAGQISDVFGRLKRDGTPSLSIDEINTITAEGWARRA